jgi:hypothetical protein
VRKNENNGSIERTNLTKVEKNKVSIKREKKRRRKKR